MMRAEDLRVYVLGHEGCEAKALYRSWLPALNRPVQVVSAYDEDWTPPDDAGVVVTSEHYRNPTLALLRRLVEAQRTPVLVLMDGILEYRNTWAHPQLPPGALFQPARCHKLACLGNAQARILEGWGNAGRCEVVGLPHLDGKIRDRPRERAAHEPFRVLVASARTPAFTDEQRERVTASFADLKEWFGRNPAVEGVALQPVWRLTGGLDAALGLPPESDLRCELSDVLSECDALITTPSTVALEGMALGMPVALLDYTNAPAYLTAAWSITAPEHRDAVLRGLLNPDAPRRLFQRAVLADALACGSPAAPRMVTLVETMVAAGHECRTRNVPLALSRRILPVPEEAHAVPLDLKALYPNAPVFTNPDATAIQAEMNRARELAQELATVKRDRERWKTNYLRLAGSFPVNALLWLRRRLLGISDNPEREAP